MRFTNAAPIALAGLVALAGFAAPAQAATEPRIGTAAATKNSVTGTLGADKRTLKLGDGVFQNESIATGQNSGAQLLFADETALTIGPNSEIALDKFVYDPGKRKGELALRAAKGAFRFVSGSGPKEGYKIMTGVGTIGVRRTSLTFTIHGQTLTLSLTQGTAILCTLAGNCITLSKPGTYVVAVANQLGNAKSKFGKACAEISGGEACSVGEGGDALFLQFLDQRGFPELGLSPQQHQPPPPGNGPPGNGPPPPPPPPGPPPAGGFPPIVTGAGNIPPGLANKTTLPPGLVNNRGPNFEPPGHVKNGK